MHGSYGTRFDLTLNENNSTRFAQPSAIVKVTFDRRQPPLPLLEDASTDRIRSGQLEFERYCKNEDYAKKIYHFLTTTLAENKLRLV